MAAENLAPAIEASGTIAVKTLLLTDLVGSTRLVERLGDQRASEVWALHDQSARELMLAHDAQEIDKADGFLLLFDRPIDGVRYALAYHRRLVDLSRRLGVELEARCGVHLGEVFLRNNPPDEISRGAKAVEVEGLAKPAAARVMSLATGRQTLLTRGAFDLARRAAVGDGDGEQPLHWLAHGAYVFKGLPEPVEVFEVGVEGFAPLAEPPDSDKAYRSMAGDEVVLGWRPAPGQHVPRRAHWPLVEKLGEGGFGEVWLAAHEKTGEKRVFKFCFETERLRALQREVTLFRLLRETLGQREDIARILDWDFDEAPYFLESEYTAGGSLLEWAAEQGGIEEVPLDVRLELVAQVADALAAAHSVGVLHKDVKPANVLINTDSEGRPKSVLTDFGIGLITDRDLLAARGITSLGLTEVAAAGDPSTGGTQLYTAPELLAGEAPTVQADIYALGISLYQMAVGDLERPLAPGWRRDVEDEILREDIASFVDGSPQRRPRSAAEVAELLRSLDQRRAARAAQRQKLIRAEKLRRRRRWVTIGTAVSALFLVVVTLLALQALRARGDAERRRQQAEELIDFMLFDLRENLETIGRLDLLEQVARSSQDYFESLAPEDEAADTAHQRGITLLNIGDVLLDQGDTEQARNAYQSARQLFTTMLATDPSREEWQEGLSRSLSMIGRAQARQGLEEEALESYNGALSFAARLAARDPEDRERRYELARVQYRMGELLWRERDLTSALESAMAAQEAAERLTEHDEVPWRHHELLIDVRILIGNIQHYADPAAALASLRRALDLSEQLATIDPTNYYWRRKMVSVFFELGDLQRDQQQLDSALESFGKASDGYRDLARQDPTRVYWRAGQAQSDSKIARIYRIRGELDAALEVYSGVLEIFTRLVADDPSQEHWQSWLADTHEDVGAIHLQRGAAAAAIAAYAASRPIREQRASSDPENPGRQNARSWNHLQTGKGLMLRGERQSARREWLRALEIIEPVTERSENRGFRDTQAQALMLLGRLEEARPVVEGLVSSGWKDAEFLELAEHYGLLQGW